MSGTSDDTWWQWWPWRLVVARMRREHPFLPAEVPHESYTPAIGPTSPAPWGAYGPTGEPMRFTITHTRDHDPQPHRCPVCVGKGLVPVGFYSTYPPPYVDHSVPQTEPCRSCGGAGLVWR